MKYICEHNIPGDMVENRMYTLSSNDKADYIVSVFNRNDVNIEIISVSRTSNTGGYYKSRCDNINEKLCIISTSTFGAEGTFGKIFQKVHCNLWLIKYLLVNCKKNEWIATYHSLFTALPLLIVKKIKKIRILNEVEELFYELDSHTPKWRRSLENQIISESDAFIFASKQLECKCNKSKKPYVIANGSYICAPIRTNKSNDKINLVYAGLIEKGKVAFKSAEIAFYLPKNYQINIIGYGGSADIDELKKYIEYINLNSECKVFFDGKKREKEYEEYLQKCSIGLCPLTSDTSFQSACFPSKITSYIANGLHVVTTQNDVLKSSKYREAITFSKDDTAESFANAILSMSKSEQEDSRKIVIELDRKFNDELAVLIKECIM